ncbi:hypothetical protein ACS5PU_02255 [Pedobacter sp. GSP4]|uniref:hypothetical protein n=1 Tax=Pedobacter sp. GSP4 TaxID=3453716 RepID=UPI003EED1E2A
MNKTIFTALLAIILMGLAQKGSAQTKEAVQKRDQRNHYRKTLQIDSTKAELVLQIQGDYKKGISAIEADSSLTDAGRRTKIDLMIHEKNRRLKAILNPVQQSKLIPTTERGDAKQFNR